MKLLTHKQDGSPPRMRGADFKRQCLCVLCQDHHLISFFFSLKLFGCQAICQAAMPIACV